jgi:cytochrome P450
MTSAAAPISIEPPPQPLTGLPWLRAVIDNPIEAWPAELYREQLVTTQSLGRPIAFVMAPDLIREVLLAQADAFDKGELSVRALKPVLGDALLTAEGAHWRWQRRAAAPAFRPEHVAELVPTMLAAAERRRAAWQSLAAGTEIDVAHEMMRTTFDVILDAMLFGRDSMDVGRIAQAITDYLAAMGWVTLLAMLRLPSWVPYPGSRKAARARLYLKDVAATAVRRARDAGSAAGNLLTALAGAADPATGRCMDDQDLADNFLTFMTAGHETTALAVTWTLYLLSFYPSVEQRIVAEVESVTGGGPLHATHVESLAYARQVVQESMRLYPPAPMIVRTSLREVTLDGRVLAPGTFAYIPIYAVHRHVRLWEEPGRFDPERFRPDIAERRDRYAYLPFGAGPRICIGMSFALTEATVILATLLRSFRLRLRPDHEPRMQLRVTLRPAGGMPMRLERR